MGKESTCNAADAGRLKFHPRAGKIPPEEGMATQSSTLVWTEEPGGPRSTGSQSGGTEVTEHARAGSRKMVLTSLFSGQHWGLRHREQTWGHRAGRGWDKWKEWLGNTHLTLGKTDSQ